MTTPKERELYNQATDAIIEEAAGKNPFAAHYLWRLASISRTVDDIYDNDQPVSREQLLELVEWLFIELPFNPFFKEYKDVLQSQHLAMWNAWMAANTWEQGDETDQIYSHVWRDTHHEVFAVVAMLTQGPAKMKEVSSKIRSLFKKELGE